MIALEQTGQHLEILGLAQAVEVIDNNVDATASITTTDFPAA